MGHACGRISKILSETLFGRKYILSLFILPDLEENSGAGGATVYFIYIPKANFKLM